MSTISRTSSTRWDLRVLDWINMQIDKIRIPRPSVFGLLMIGALIAFETFNFGTTEFALQDLLGQLSFAGLHWATILAIAFCGMDFAGIAHLFTPGGHRKGSADLWYLLGAWLLAATMNAMLTWWAVSLALLSHEGLGNEILGREALLSSVPVFVAMLVWLIRVLMIGTFTSMGRRIFTAGDARKPVTMRARKASGPPRSNNGRPIRPAPKPVPHRNGHSRTHATPGSR
ncbi:MAG: hypothetical protein PVF85_10135 [Anaerolineales bacterium]